MDLGILLSLAAILLLLVCSAFFAGAETAMTAASRARMLHLEQEGNRRAGIVQRLIAKREHLIGATLLGNNLVNILASSLATSILIRLEGDAGVAYATAIMTVVIVVYGEILPKSYAIRRADQVAMRVAPFMRAIVLMLTPVNDVIQFIVRGTQKAFGIRPPDVSAAIAREELKGAFAMHAVHGGIVKDEQAMLDSVLDLDEVEVSQIMTHRRVMRMIDADAPPAAIVDAMLNSGHTRMPVFEKEPDNIIGVLHAKDILRAAREAEGGLEAFDVRTILREPWFVPDTTTLREQLEAFRKRRLHFALVVDEYGSLMGLVTLEDVLEEIVGEIEDEYDMPVPGVTKTPDGNFMVDGSVPIRDLNREYGWRLPEDEASTVAGLVIHEAAQIPVPGQAFVFHGFKFEVVRRQRNQITKLRLTPPAEDTGKDDAA